MPPPAPLPPCPIVPTAAIRNSYYEVRVSVRVRVRVRVSVRG